MERTQQTIDQQTVQNIRNKITTAVLGEVMAFSTEKYHLLEKELTRIPDTGSRDLFGVCIF